MIPCFAHIGKQRLDLLVHETVGHFLDRLTNLHSGITDFLSLPLNRRFHHIDVETERKTHNVVPSPDRESHAVSDEIRICVQ